MSPEWLKHPNAKALVRAEDNDPYSVAPEPATPMTERIVLSIDRCSKHRDFYAICIKQGNLGHRLTPSKCCGQWTIVKQWTLTPDAAREIANQLLSAASAVPNAAARASGSSDRE